MVGFVKFRDFAGDRALAVGSEGLGELRERLRQAVRRLVEDHGPLLGRELREQGRPPLLLREEALEAETVARQAGRNERRDAGGRARERLHLYSLAGTLAGEKETGIADSGRPCVADQGHVQPAEDALLDHPHGLVLVEFMMREQAAFDLIVLKQHAGRSRVLGEDEIGLLQHLKRTEGDVGKVADRSGHYVQPSCHYESFLRTAIISLYTTSEFRFQSGKVAIT